MSRRWRCLAACAMLLLLAARGACAQACGAWLPYWAAEDALEELDALAGRLDTAVAFAALFDDEDNVFMPEETARLLDRMQRLCTGTGTEAALSVVNDVELAPGRYENKSADLLRRLLADEQSVQRHIGQLAALAQDCGVRVLEIDYEGFGKDAALWARFAAFVAALSERLGGEGIALRVALSWDAPRYIDLPEGPVYTVMCYNLCGAHSGPGPKADYAFLESVAALYAPWEGSVRMALATGGFVWAGGQARALTQRDGQALLETHGVRPVRDADSGALYGAYAQDGELHDVWLVDAATLAAWRDALRARGFAGFDLFRLGGSDMQDMERRFFTGQDGETEEAWP